MILGFDPSTKDSYCAAIGGSVISTGIWRGVAVSSGEVYWGDKWCKVSDIEAAIVETPDPSKGVFIHAGEYAASRARQGNMMRLARIAEQIACTLHLAGVLLYTPTRDVILGDAKIVARKKGEQDRKVTAYLHLHDYLHAEHDQAGKKLLVKSPRCLTKVDARDACMAALWNWKHPANQPYRYQRSAPDLATGRVA
jgi:hypothetical protein